MPRTVVPTFQRRWPPGHKGTMVMLDVPYRQTLKAFEPKRNVPPRVKKCPAMFRFDADDNQETSGRCCLSPITAQTLVGVCAAQKHPAEITKCSVMFRFEADDNYYRGRQGRGH